MMSGFEGLAESLSVLLNGFLSIRSCFKRLCDLSYFIYIISLFYDNLLMFKKMYGDNYGS